MIEKKISLITHFYNNPQHVYTQLQYLHDLLSIFSNNLELIIIDDGSTNPISFTNPRNLPIRYFRILKDIPWNQSGARNLGAFHAKYEWGLFFDIDQRPTHEGIAILSSSIEFLDKCTMYYLKVLGNINLQNNKECITHPNTFIVNIQEFKTHGMYDEDFAGHYGFEDLYMPLVWENNKRKRAMILQTDFFIDQKFFTSNLNRDFSRNQALAQYKSATGLTNSNGILRFNWTEIIP